VPKPGTHSDALASRKPLLQGIGHPIRLVAGSYVTGSSYSLSEENQN